VSFVTKSSRGGGFDLEIGFGENQEMIVYGVSDPS
jgi:hypothetical protein